MEVDQSGVGSISRGVEMTSLKNNGAFLNSFWDLASDERERRLTAACHIVEHVKSEEGSTIDTDYALKRLVRLQSLLTVNNCMLSLCMRAAAG